MLGLLGDYGPCCSRCAGRQQRRKVRSRQRAKEKVAWRRDLIRSG